jgi:hypothetical protein
MNFVACCSILLRSFGGTSPVRLSQIAKLLWISEWLHKVCASSLVSTPLRISKSSKFSRITAKAASWPLISGSLVGKRSSCLGTLSTSNNEGVARLYSPFSHQKLRALFVDVISVRSVETEHNPSHPDVVVVFHFTQDVFDAPTMQSEESNHFIERRAVLPAAEPHENLFPNVINRVFDGRYCGGVRTHKLFRFLKLKDVPLVVAHYNTLFALNAPESPHTAKAVVSLILPITRKSRRTRRAMRYEVFRPQNSESRTHLLTKQSTEIQDVKK